MKYWDINGTQAILKRQIRNNNKKSVNHVYRNLNISGIRFIVTNDTFITSEERQELLYII